MATSSPACESIHPPPKDLGEEVFRCQDGDRRSCVFRRRPGHYIAVVYRHESLPGYSGWFGRRHGDFATAAEAIAAVRDPRA